MVLEGVDLSSKVDQTKPHNWRMALVPKWLTLPKMARLAQNIYLAGTAELVQPPLTFFLTLIRVLPLLSINFNSVSRAPMKFLKNYSKSNFINPDFKPILFLFFLPSLLFSVDPPPQELPIYYWQQSSFINFGDYLSVKLVERITGKPVNIFKKKRLHNEKKLLAIGSILVFALNDDIIWGTGLNGKRTDKSHFQFTNLDVRAVRGPLTRQFLKDNFQIDCPEIYGDPALLIPYFFPEFKRNQNPQYEYIIIPHYSEQKFFPKEKYRNVVYPTDPWNEVIEKITDSQFVISSSLHGIIVAEAFGIPARLLKITDNEPLLKYQDYYFGTNRPYFQYATSVEEALKMGGEPPFRCDLKQLYEAFPFEYWGNSHFQTPIFN